MSNTEHKAPLPPRASLWAPWRMEYIEGLSGGDQDACFLCHALATPERDAEQYVLWRTERTLVMLNRFPYASGHTLIAPAAHAAELEQLDEQTLLELMCGARDVKRVIQAAMHAQGFNIGFNLGRCAGAGLPGHVHLHVVPRWGGDTNFMAVLGDVKVIPQALSATRRVLLEAAERVGVRGRR